MPTAIAARIIATVIAAFAIAAPAAAQDNYPSRPVRIIVGFGAGASADTAARVVAQKLGQILGQQFIVENKPGAGGILGNDVVAKATPDGYMLGVMTCLLYTSPSPRD